MAESPLLTLGRLLGGVVLMQGRLGHQVLGQMLVMNSNEVAVAGAIAVVAATTGQRSAAGQIVVRTVVPALAARALFTKAERRVDRKTANLAAREERFKERRRDVEEVEDQCAKTEQDNRDLRAELDRLSAQLRALQPVTPPPIPPIPPPGAALPALPGAPRPAVRGRRAPTRKPATPRRPKPGKKR